MFKNKIIKILLFNIFYTTTAWCEITPQEERSMVESRLEFTFDVRSSGQDLYACNAGISKADGKNGIQYTSRYSSSDSNGTAEAKTLYSSTYGEITLNQVPYLAVHNTTDLHSDKPNYNLGSRLDDDLQRVSLKTRLTKVLFDIGSEHYDSSFFIDICYDNGFQSESLVKNFSDVFQANIFLLNSRDGQTYQQNAIPRVTILLECDGKEMYRTDQAFNSSELTSGNIQIDWPQGQDPPKKCVIRYFFQETAVQKVRKHFVIGDRFLPIKTTTFVNP